MTLGLYHTGIKKDNNQVWKRVSDVKEVQLEGWLPGHPRSHPASSYRWDYLVWQFSNDSNKNMILNSRHLMREIICEYF